MCPHEDDITYGKSVEITEDIQAVHMLCTGCNAVGTVIEERSKEDPDHWESISEIWHEPSDYLRSDIAEHMTIKLQEV